jgi:hypothetical protein
MPVSGIAVRANRPSTGARRHVTFRCLSGLVVGVIVPPHTAAEYLRCVREVISRVKGEPDGIERIRLRKGLANELMNEAFPIGLLASTYYGASEEVRIRLKVGNQSYDAIVSAKEVW